MVEFFYHWRKKSVVCLALSVKLDCNKVEFQFVCPCDPLKTCVGKPLMKMHFQNHFFELVNHVESDYEP